MLLALEGVQSWVIQNGGFAWPQTSWKEGCKLKGSLEVGYGSCILFFFFLMLLLLLLWLMIGSMRMMMIDDHRWCKWSMWNGSKRSKKVPKTTATEAEAPSIILPSVTEAKATLATKSNSGKKGKINWFPNRNTNKISYTPDMANGNPKALANEIEHLELWHLQ